MHREGFVLIVNKVGYLLTNGKQSLNLKQLGGLNNTNNNNLQTQYQHRNMKTKL